MIVTVSPTLKVPIAGNASTVTTTGPVERSRAPERQYLYWSSCRCRRDTIECYGAGSLRRSKVEPFIVTLVPIGPACGERLLIDGVGSGRGTTTVESKFPSEFPRRPTRHSYWLSALQSSALQPIHKTCRRQSSRCWNSW